MIALLEAGADIAAPRRLTALQLAADAGHEHCVCTLLLAGASVPAAAAKQPLIKAALEQLGLAEPGGSTAAELAGTLRAELTCPITHEIMEQPVVAADGATYERHAIESELRPAPSLACMCSVA